MGVQIFSDSAYQAYWKVVNGDTFYGKKQPHTEGFKSTASDPSDPTNTFSVWLRASAKGTDEVVAEPEIVEPEPVYQISETNVALNTQASMSSTDPN